MTSPPFPDLLFAAELGSQLKEATFYNDLGKKVKVTIFDNYLRIQPEKKLLAGVGVGMSMAQRKEKNANKERKDGAPIIANAPLDPAQPRRPFPRSLASH